MKKKIIIYQLLPRLFKNAKSHPVPYGTIEQNGCGKLQDIKREDLLDIKRLGVTHVWYTGLLEHATQTDYSSYGIAPDNASVVKGRAGSPYAIKDYYDIDPDLAVNVCCRKEEFRSLLSRTHRAGLKCIMDFVPNHVARHYVSDARPEGVRDLGEDDDKSQAFSAQNNFYYLPGEDFVAPLEGDTPYIERPARATGNDQFTSRPTKNDWYETVKLNYGVDYLHGMSRHFSPIPSTWEKMCDILLYWAGTGVDGFRCDMAEMVPAAFWGWAIGMVKRQYPDVIFIAEVYNPGAYRQYLGEGRFDYLYDKVGLYDTLRNVTCGYTSAAAITPCWQATDDIREHMLSFLENHDEQRLASDFFAGDGRRGLAPLVVSCMMGTNPFMLYFGQELGEKGMDEEGFSGRDGRTTIFDYWSVASLRAYQSGEGSVSARVAAELRETYRKVLTLARDEEAVRSGSFFDLMYVNYDHPETFCAERMYAFLRKSAKTLLLVCANFSTESRVAEVRIPSHAFLCLELKEGNYEAEELLRGERVFVDLRRDGMATFTVPAGSASVLKVKL